MLSYSPNGGWFSLAKLAITICIAAVFVTVGSAQQQTASRVFARNVIDLGQQERSAVLRSKAFELWRRELRPLLRRWLLRAPRPQPHLP